MKNIKRRKPVSSKRSHPRKKRRDFKPKFKLDWFWICFFLLIVFAIIFKLYKAHVTGMTVDEATSVYTFSQELTDALRRYRTPNNHVLHSVLLWLTRQKFSSYIHWFRIPACFFGIMYTLAVAYLTRKVVNNRVLLLGVLAVVLFSRHVFDYTYLARGYALSLGAFFAGIGVLLYLLKRKIPFKHCWLPILILSLINYICLGSLLSTLFVLFPLNAYVVLFCAGRFFKNPPHPLVSRLVMGLSVPAVSGASLYLLYRHIIPLMDEIIKKYFKLGPEFFGFFREALVGWGLPVRVFGIGLLADLLLWSVALLIFISLAGLLYYASRIKISFKAAIKQIDWAQPAVFIPMITLLSFIFMYVYRDLSGRSLGLARNHLFMITLSFLCVGILVDRFYETLTKPALQRLIRIGAAVIFFSIMVGNFPSFYAAGGKTCSKSVLDRLAGVDSTKTWVIRLSDKMRNCGRALYYYNTYGYKSVMHYNAKQYPYDVTIWTMAEKPDEVPAVHLDEDWFSRRYQVQVTVDNPQLKERIKRGKPDPP